MPVPSLEKPLEQMNYTELKTEVEKHPEGGSDKEIKERRTDLGKISKELEKRAGYPKNDEITATFEGVIVNERIDLAKKLISRALTENGIHTADQATDRTTEGITLSREPGNLDEPQVLFKQVITEETNFWGKTKTIKSDELQLVVKLNNGDTPETNTVVICVVKHQNGVPQVNEDEKGTFLVMTQKEFDEQSLATNEGVRAQWLRGELTNELYLKKFGKENGVSLHEYQKRIDEELPNNPAHWKAEREKGDLIAKVEDKYGHLLQEAQQEILDIKNHIREAQKTEKTRIETILHSDEFVTYMDLLTSGDETNSKRLKKILSSTWGLNDAQINELLNK